MKNFQIVVNTRMLLKNRLDGIGYFSYQTLNRIVSEHPEHEFIFLFDRKYNKEFIFGDNVKGNVLYPSVRTPLLNYIWYQISVKRYLAKTKPDLFISPDGLLALGSNTKQLAVIHDINFKHYPADLKYLLSKYFNYFFPRSANTATRIATVSQFSKQDICNQYKINPSKIDVVFSGNNAGFVPIELEQKNKIKDKYTKGQEFFLFIGSLHPRKNIIRLLKAFDGFKKENESNIKMVLLGSMFWGKKEIDQTLKEMKFNTDVIFTGRVSDSEIRKITASALCLTYVPYFEGFGIPLLEAMHADIPIICSNTTSMPEVAGDAALYVDPFNFEKIKNAMQKIYTDGQLRDDLINAGKIQRDKFSWDKTASKLWETVIKCLE